LYIRITAIVRSGEFLLTSSTRIGRRHVFVIVIYRSISHSIVAVNRSIL